MSLSTTFSWYPQYRYLELLLLGLTVLLPHAACFTRNTAVETVEQQLLFVGTECGKLLAVRDLIKKVPSLRGVEHHHYHAGGRMCGDIQRWSVSIPAGFHAAHAGVRTVHRSRARTLPRVGLRGHQRGRHPCRSHTATGAHAHAHTHTHTHTHRSKSVMSGPDLCATCWVSPPEGQRDEKFPLG